MKNLLAYVFVVMIMALWTQRSLDYTLSAMKDRPVEVGYGWSVLATIPGPITFLYNVGTEIYRRT